MAMQWKLEDLRHKEVIDLRTGEKLGYIDDVELDTDSRTIRGFVIYGRRCFWGLFRREEDLFIPCESVRLYGKDVLLTDFAEGFGGHVQK
jgi:YlmC/YmxH family sporulation protein